MIDTRPGVSVRILCARLTPDAQPLERTSARTPAQVQNGRVSFRLVREAGTVEGEGTFVNGQGSGTFRFTPNRSFVDAMRSRGFDFDRAGKHGDRRYAQAEKDRHPLRIAQNQPVQMPLPSL